MTATKTPYDKPLPALEPGSEPFWAGLRAHRLIIQTCRACGHTFAPYQPMCPACWSGDVQDRPSTGFGTVYTFSVVHRAPLPSFRPDLPYVVAVVELDEGVYLTTNIVGCAVDDVRIGMPVQVTYVQATEEVTLAKFRPRD